jgi:hypothetical protein
MPAADNAILYVPCTMFPPCGAPVNKQAGIPQNGPDAGAAVPFTIN